MKAACQRHDQANLLLLPVLGALAVGGLLGYVDALRVTTAFAWYIAADFLWVAAQPEAVPSLPSIILVHHAVTLLLLCFPLRYPHLSHWTCWDGLVEINTLFLIARRQLRHPGVRAVLSGLYWTTFFPLRMGLYPYLLLRFWWEMQPHPLWEALVVCGCQLVLCGFNWIFLWLSIANWRKGGRRGSPTRGGSASPGLAGRGGSVAVEAKLSTAGARPSMVRLEAKGL